MSGNARVCRPGGLLELRGSLLNFDAGQSDKGICFLPASNDDIML